LRFADYLANLNCVEVLVQPKHGQGDDTLWHRHRRSNRAD
jgi:hypothetical protein